MTALGTWSSPGGAAALAVTELHVSAVPSCVAAVPPGTGQCRFCALCHLVTFALVVGTVLASAAEIFSLQCSPLGQELVIPCIPKSQPAGNFTACLCPPIRGRTRLRQHKCTKGSLEESWVETAIPKGSFQILRGKQALALRQPFPLFQNQVNLGWGRTHLPWDCP